MTDDIEEIEIISDKMTRTRILNCIWRHHPVFLEMRGDDSFKCWYEHWEWTSAAGGEPELLRFASTLSDKQMLGWHNFGKGSLAWVRSAIPATCICHCHSHTPCGCPR